MSAKAPTPMPDLEEMPMGRAVVPPRRRPTSDPGGRILTLDLDNDPHALAAVLAYAGSCGQERPQLAADLYAWAWSELARLKSS